MNKLLEQMTFPDTTEDLSEKEKQLLEKINFKECICISETKTGIINAPEILLPNITENIKLIKNLEKKGFILRFDFDEKIFYYNPDFCKIITIKIKFPQIQLGQNNLTGIISGKDDSEVKKASYIKYILQNIFLQNRKNNLHLLARIYYDRECGIISIPSILKKEIFEKLERGSFICHVLNPEEKKYHCNICGENFLSILEVDIIKCNKCGNLVSQCEIYDEKK